MESASYILAVGESQFQVEIGDNHIEKFVGTLKLDKSEKLKVSVFPAERKMIFSNGYAGFNRLLLEEVTVTITPVK